MATFTIGANVAPQHTTAPDMLKAFQQADELGAETIWTWDHFFPTTGDPAGPMFEAWNVVACCGMVIKRAHVGALVMGIGYRTPSVVSKMASTLDLFLGGRFVLGLGAGWFERDYTEFGIPFGTVPSRFKDLEDGIDDIKRHWAIDLPAPPRGSIPIMIGGGGEKVTLRIAAQHADIWHGFGDPETWGRKNRILTEWCEKVGRDPKAIQRSVSASPKPEQTRAEYKAFLEERVPALLEVGATDIVCGMEMPYQMWALEALLEWRAKHG